MLLFPTFKVEKFVRKKFVRKKQLQKKKLEKKNKQKNRVLTNTLTKALKSFGSCDQCRTGFGLLDPPFWVYFVGAAKVLNPRDQVYIVLFVFRLFHGSDRRQDWETSSIKHEIRPPKAVKFIYSHFL